MYPLAVALRKKLDCTVSGVLLPGHGSHPRFLDRTTWPEWFNTVQGELAYLLEHFEQVYAVGLSMGGLLAIYAGICMPQLSGVVSINAPIINRFRITNWAPGLRRICPYFPKPRRQRSYLQGKPRFAYDVYPLKALASMLDLRQLVKKEITHLTVPILLVQSHQDETVDPRSMEWLSQHIVNAPQDHLWLKNSGHIATMGPEQELLVQKVAQFIQNSIDHREVIT